MEVTNAGVLCAWTKLRGESIRMEKLILVPATQQKTWRLVINLVIKNARLSGRVEPAALLDHWVVGPIQVGKGSLAGVAPSVRLRSM